MTVAVLGLGYVGLPVVRAFAEAGARVVGIDVDPKRVHELAAQLTTDEEGLDSAFRNGALRVTTKAEALGDADVVFICVPTPLEDGLARHQAVQDCASAFARHGRADALVILESTVRPGFLVELQTLLGHGGCVALAYAPERVDPQPRGGQRLIREIPRLVAGIDPDAEARAVQVLSFVGVSAHPVPLAVAEYAKLLENAFRLLNVAFIDEFASLCRRDGVDPRAVVRAAATKPFGFHPFWPGAGAGGHCVAVDPAFLAESGRRRGSALPLLEAALAANARRPLQLAGEVAARTAPGATVLVVGLTYKAGVADTRESAALVVARTLGGMNRRVLTFDSLVHAPSDLESVDLVQGLGRADAVVLLVPQPTAVVARLVGCGLPLFDATGSIADAVEL